ncbi:hypothetical protein [Paenibacillus periandrae]|uniref:hypothetical protein n=1 Tax=Paenibacillus periandrae TaxID=1761741 RepID=UPI001F08EDF5|nr:hypothetical protein [Paenibacillus periandrae]
MSLLVLTATTAKASSMSDTEVKSILIGGSCLNALLLIALIYLIYRLAQLKRNDGKTLQHSPKERPRRLTEQSVGQVIERQILNLAAERGGTLSIVETAYHTKLSTEISERALESFVRRGHAQIKDRNGAALYYFPGMLTEYEKVTARPLSDLLDE